MTLILSGTDGLSDIDGSAATPAIRGTDTNTGIFFPAADTIAFSEGGVESMRIDSSGNVGIGTSSPGYKLDVSGGGGSIATARVINGNVGGSDGAQILLGNSANFTNAYFRLNGGGNSSQAGIGSLNIGVTESVPMAFYTNNTERARIDSSGTLLVGTTSGSYHVLSKTLNGNYAAGVINGSASSPYALILNLSGVTGGAGGGFLTCVDNANRLLIAGNGNVSNVNGSYGAISDAKMKENVVDATPKLEKLKQVRIVNFNMKGDTQKQIGVVAQELEQIFPGMVEETPDRDAEGNDLGTTTKSVKYSVFVPMLIKAIQEQQAIIQSLTARIEALEGK